MKLKTLIVALLRGISIVVLISGCKNIELKFRPNFFIGDPEKGRIVNEKGEEISCIEEKFANYACMSIDDINKLRRVLKSRCK